MSSETDWDLTATLRGKVAVVTGSAGGIGQQISRALAACGSRVAAIDVDEDRNRTLVSSLDDPQQHMAASFDLSDVGGLNHQIDNVVDQLGRIDILVHLAAVLRRQSLEEITEDDWDAQMDTNLKAAFFLNRQVALQMIKQESGGRIINFASQGWWTGGFGGSTVYSASKGGLVSMSRSLARVLAPHRITVNAIAPGAVDTEMLRGDLSSAELRTQVAPIPMGRLATPGEMVSTVLYLACDQSEYITGATINATGGWLMY